MKIVIIGGSGLVGTRVVKKLTEAGHEAVAAAPKSGVNALTDIYYATRNDQMERFYSRILSERGMNTFWTLPYT